MAELQAVLRHSMGWLDWQVQTQAASESATVAAGCYLLA